MSLLEILEIPLDFIKENLTGWVIVIFIILIIYFVALRNYYVKKEQFYDQAVALKDMEDIENAEETLLEDNEQKSQKSMTSQKLNNRDYNTEMHRESQVMKHSDSIDTEFDQPENDTKTRNRNTRNTRKTRNTSNTKQKVNVKVKEGFENPTITTIQTNTNIRTAPAAVTTPFDNKIISTTLFDNLNLTELQIQSCKANYNQVIAQLYIDLGNLNDMYSRNRYLNVKRQFDSYLAHAIDNVINYLNNPIKSFNTLTRTAIRSDILSTLNNVLEILVDKTNNTISTEMNKLATLNSTTTEYTTQLNNITQLRSQLEKYFGIAKLIVDLGHNVSIANKEIDSILNKSYILPIYERHFDKISQLVKSDFNDDETSLSSKYGKAYTDFLEQQKKDELNINPLNLASKIESGIVSLLTRKENNPNQYKQSNNTNGDELVEQMTRDYGYTSDNSNIRPARSNPIPQQQENLVKDTVLNHDNIYSDFGSRGNYLIDNKTQSHMLEGFQNETAIPQSTAPKSNTPNLIKAIMNNEQLNEKFKNEDTKTSEYENILGKLMSGDFIQYVLDTVNKNMGGYYSMYKDKVNSYMGVGIGVNSSGEKGLKLEDNMIPAGFLLFIISMLLYFVDITS